MSKIADRVASRHLAYGGPQEMRPEDANLQQQVWDAARPHFQRIYKVMWYVPGEGYEGFLVSGSENAQAELEALKARGRFTLQSEQAIPLEEFKRIVESLAPAAPAAAPPRQR